MAQVPLPPLSAGQDAREALARATGALVTANGRLGCSAGWYATVRKGYGEKAK